MFRIDATGKAGAKPAYGADAGEGWFQSGATVSSEWLNHVQEEIAQLIEAAGVTLDKSDDAQLLAVAKGVLALRADTLDTGLVSSAWTCLVAASEASRSSGDRSAVVASSGALASGARTAAIAVRNGTVSGAVAAALAAEDPTVTGDMAVSVASRLSEANGNRCATLAADACVVDGDESVAIACHTAPVPGQQCANIASGGGASAKNLRTANLASSGSTSGHASSSQNCANVAGDNCQSRGLNNATIASELATVGDAAETTNLSLMAACYDGDVEADRAAAIASHTCTIPTGNDAVVVLASQGIDASSFGGSVPAHSVIGGVGAAGWKLLGASGNIKCSGAVTGSGLDYAELVENAELGEIPVGCYVTFCADSPHGIRTAAAGDWATGIVSVEPTVLGGADATAWAGAQLRDQWGRRLWDEVEEISWPAWEGPASKAPPAERRPGKVHRETRTIAVWGAYVGEAPEVLPPRVVRLAEDLVMWPEQRQLLEEGAPRPPAPLAELVTEAWLRWDGYRGPADSAPCAPPSTARVTTTQVPRRNPAWDPKREHVPREDRPAEYTKVGLMGQLRLRVTAAVRPGQWLEPTAGGHGKPSAAQRHSWCMRLNSPFDAKRGYAIATVFFVAGGGFINGAASQS